MEKEIEEIQEPKDQTNLISRLLCLHLAIYLHLIGVLGSSLDLVLLCVPTRESMQGDVTWVEPPILLFITSSR